MHWAKKPFCSVVVNRDSHWILLTFSLQKGRNSFTGLCKSFNQSEGHTVQVEDMRRNFYHLVYCIKATENLKTAKGYRVEDFSQHFHDLNIVFSKKCFAHIDGGLAIRTFPKSKPTIGMTLAQRAVYEENLWFGFKFDIIFKVQS